MKYMIVAGDHPRHRHVIEALLPQIRGEVDLLIYTREALEPVPPNSTGERLTHLWRKHFELRTAVEAQYFGREPTESLAPLFASTTRASSSDFNIILGGLLAANNFDGLLSVGPGMILESTLDLLPAKSYNLHLGLSPRYRGSATLFWPSYFLEPEFSGTTLHRFSKTPDSGDIVHQTGLVIRDTSWNVHESSAETITQALPEISDVLASAFSSRSLKVRPQPGAGKTFLTTDFRPEHLVSIYETYEGSPLSFISNEIQREWKKPLLFKENLHSND